MELNSDLILGSDFSNWDTDWSAEQVIRIAYLDNWDNDVGFIQKLFGIEQNIENKRNAIPTQAPKCDKTQHGI